MSVNSQEGALVLECETREEKMHQAHNFSLRGYTNKQISKFFNVTPSTVASWLRDQKTKLKETRAEIDGTDYTVELRSQFAQLRKEAWSNYLNARKEIDRARYLAMIRATVVDEAKLLQSMGALYKEPEKTETSVDINIELSEEKVEALAMMLLSKEVGASTDKMIEMRGSEPLYIDATPLEQLDKKKEEKSKEKLALPVPVQEVISYDDVMSEGEDF
jgi:transcriptional regulator with XRE-family HTH domain